MAAADDQRIQIADALRQRYFQLIPQLQTNWIAEQHDKNRLSRSLAAFAISGLADVSPAEAVNAVVDGGNDNGLDAVQFDRPENHLWVVQSKAGGAPDLGEVKKFTGGIRDLIAGRFDRFNASFRRLQPDIEEALATDGLKIVAGVVHQADELGPHGRAELDQVRIELNRFVDRFDWLDLNLPTVHQWLTAEHAIPSVNITITLENWYGVNGPRRAFYGLVSAGQLATLYRTHGKALLEKNIRHYLGGQSVNSAIARTVRERPEDLFYLNNGLTAVCSSVTPMPGGTNDLAAFSI